MRYKISPKLFRLFAAIRSIQICDFASENCNSETIHPGNDLLDGQTVVDIVNTIYIYIYVGDTLQKQFIMCTRRCGGVIELDDIVTSC